MPLLLNCAEVGDTEGHGLSSFCPADGGLQAGPLIEVNDAMNTPRQVVEGVADDAQANVRRRITAATEQHHAGGYARFEVASANAETGWSATLRRQSTMVMVPIWRAA